MTYEISQTPTDNELIRKLSASGAVLIRGAKACGKTESAKQLARSVLNVDRDPQVQAFIKIGVLLK